MIILKIFNIILILLGLMAFIGGVVGIKEGITKRKFGKDFGESLGMLVFGVITVAWIMNNLLG